MYDVRKSSIVKNKFDNDFFFIVRWRIICYYYYKIEWIFICLREVNIFRYFFRFMRFILAL